MAYIYAAELWCDSCGKDLCRTLPKPDNPDERDYDSDDYPKYVGDVGLSDSPRHCGAGADCLEAIDLREWGMSEGAGDYKIGALLTSELTEYGVEYVRELFARESTPYLTALHALWRDTFWELNNE